MPNVSQVGGTFLDTLVDKLIPPETVAFLNTTLFNDQRYLLFFNYWSIIHFIAGVLFFRFISKDFKLWVKINIAFEVVELILAMGGNPLFVEEAIDIFWDILLSLAGFKAAEKYMK